MSQIGGYFVLTFGLKNLLVKTEDIHLIIKVALSGQTYMKRCSLSPGKVESLFLHFPLLMINHIPVCFVYKGSSGTSTAMH